MSFDFFPQENAATLDRAARSPSLAPEPGVFTNFLPGAFKTGMQGFASVARSVDMLGAVGPIVQDAFAGGGTTDAQDAYFKEHEFFNDAVDYWTPRPGEVGTAGKVVGSLVSGLAQVAVSPALAVGNQVLSTGEDLVRQGVEARKAVGAGIVQGTGLGLGIYLPIFGQSWMMKALVAGAGSNVAQGIVTRAATAKILEGTDAAKQFNPWDAENLILDAMMGVGFGTLAHLSAPERAAIDKNLTPTDKAAILAANQARHIEDTTAPGTPLSDADRTAHAEAIKRAVDDLLAGRQPNVDGLLRDTQFADDPARVEAQQQIRTAIDEQATAIVAAAMEAEGARIAAEAKPGFLRTANDLIALGAKSESKSPEIQRAIDIAQKSGATRTAEERIYLDAFLKGQAHSYLTEPIKVLEQALPAARPAPQNAKEGARLSFDPIVSEALARVAGRENMTITDTEGKTTNLVDALKESTDSLALAKKDAKLFEVASACMFGGA